MTSVPAEPADAAAPADEPFPGWDWEDPQGLDVLMTGFTENLAACRTLETVRAKAPRTRAEFLELGLTGIEFASFRTPHPQGLGTDLLPQRTADATTAPGPVYLVDGAHRFTQLDIGDPLPFDDAVVDWVYAEHLVEHVPLGTVVRWLGEVRRILRPGGVLRLTTPDLELYVQGYLDQRGGFFARHRRRLRTLRVGPPMPERRAFMVNQIFYHFGHRWIYDEAELRHALAAAGFDGWQVSRRAYREGTRSDVAALDTGFRRDETLYLEAVAPGSPQESDLPVGAPSAAAGASPGGAPAEAPGAGLRETAGGDSAEASGAGRSGAARPEETR